MDHCDSDCRREGEGARGLVEIRNQDGDTKNIGVVHGNVVLDMACWSRGEIKEFF